MRSIAPALALLLGALGTVAADSAAALERADDELRAAASRGQNPAVLALLENAERELGAGRPEQASALLEQALRIEPRNPTVWHYLGLAHLELGDTAQANAMAAKSRSLVAGDRGLRDWASRSLIEPARGFIDSGRERSDVAEQRRWPPVEAAAQAWRDVRSLASREHNDAAVRARREQEARRAEIRSRSAAELDRRNRRDGSNDRARRRTWL